MYILGHFLIISFVFGLNMIGTLINRVLKEHFISKLASNMTEFMHDIHILFKP